MLGRDEALGVKDALRIIIDNIKRTMPETSVSIEDAYGRVLSRYIQAPEALPGFARSTVDGYAVFSEDTFGSQSYLNIVGEVFMGQAPEIRLKRGEAIRIPTGGMLPEGADSVLMLEHAQEIDGILLEVQKPVSAGENVIGKDEDVKEGEVILTKGRILRAEDIALCAGLGITNLSVYEKPRVSIISTGDEIVPYFSPIRAGLIRDTNSFALKGLTEDVGGVIVMREIVLDDIDALSGALNSTLECSDIVLISGGSSVGKKDIVANVVKEVSKILLHGVAMRPGKPFFSAISGDSIIFGLPGHPISAIQCFEVFVKPAIYKLSGIEPPPSSCKITARLTRSISSQAGRHDFIRVSISRADGEVLASPVLGRSGLLSLALRADGVIEIPPEHLGLEKGQLVEVTLRGKLTF